MSFASPPPRRTDHRIGGVCGLVVLIGFPGRDSLPTVRLGSSKKHDSRRKFSNAPIQIFRCSPQTATERSPEIPPPQPSPPPPSTSGFPPPPSNNESPLPDCRLDPVLPSLPVIGYCEFFASVSSSSHILIAVR